MTKKTKPTFAAALKAARAKSGLSQVALAERANLRLFVVTKLEQGLSKQPNSTTLLRLAKALGVTAEDLGAVLIA